MKDRTKNILFLAACGIIAFMFTFAWTSAHAAPFLVSDPQCKYEGSNDCAESFMLTKDGTVWVEMELQDVGTDEVRVVQGFDRVRLAWGGAVFDGVFHELVGRAVVAGIQQDLRGA